MLMVDKNVYTPDEFFISRCARRTIPIFISHKLNICIYINRDTAAGVKNGVDLYFIQNQTKATEGLEKVVL